MPLLLILLAVIIATGMIVYKKLNNNLESAIKKKQSEIKYETENIMYQERDDSMDVKNLSSKDNIPKYVSVIGSSISAICFFAPWIGCSDRTASGADLGGNFWLIFASSAISLLAFLFFNSQKTLSRAKPIILISSLIGLGFLLYKYIQFQSSEYHNDFEIKWGSVATLIGFVLSLVGTIGLEDEGTKNVVINTKNIGSIFCANCGKEYSSEAADKFCDECGNKI